MSIDIGKLDKRVKIEVFEKFKDNDGITKSDWRELKTLWCGVNEAWGKEYIAAKETNSKKETTFTFRYYKQLEEHLNTRKIRLVFKCNYYNIKHIDNVKYANVKLIVKAERDVK